MLTSIYMCVFDSDSDRSLRVALKSIVTRSIVSLISSCGVALSQAHLFMLHELSFSALRLKIMSCAEIALSSGSSSSAFSIRSSARTLSPRRMSAMELQ